MRRYFLGTTLILLTLLSSRASALALGPEEFAAAKRLSCVLAQDSLGYLTEKDYQQLTDEVLDEFEAEQGDVIYAKALGYFDGLMFGIPEQDDAGVTARLQSFVASQACTMVVGVSYSL
ncbi:hypothetical protein [Kineobactrum salinum]|uniref:Uncharacterized protein n=1 Tax=Kineobactrum salinum TaxID=2708301 RepID=A0A6C0U7D8_9GAMM|nr:hypothetical protein [Kineobactrum salinum]QIB67239.1 hypothetical protein G3T16_19370 [Kineobactrum salinum]